MLNRDAPIRSVPFFWTMQFGKSLRYTGEDAPPARATLHWAHQCTEKAPSFSVGVNGTRFIRRTWVQLAITVNV